MNGPSLAQCLWVTEGANPRVEHLKGASIWEAPAFLKHYTRLKKFVMNEHYRIHSKAKVLR
jgi:hypothetical protein